jgi:hypothetical protein
MLAYVHFREHRDLFDRMHLSECSSSYGLYNYEWFLRVIIHVCIGYPLYSA